MKLSIITVTYNVESVLDGYLKSLEQSEVGLGLLAGEVLVVDNASEDNTVAQLKKSAVPIKIICSKENLGFSAANNLGLKEACGENLLFLNPDTEFKAGVLTTLLEYLDAHEEVGAVTPRVLLPDGQDDLNTRRNFPTPLSALQHFLHLPGSDYYITKEPTQEQAVPAIGGAFLMAKQAVVTKVGSWDEDFFLYGEDLDYCYRINEAGYKIMYVPAVQITHLGGVSTGIKKSGERWSKASKKQKRAMAKYSVEAMALFYQKHLANKHNLIINALVAFGFRVLCMVRVLQFSLK